MAPAAQMPVVIPAPPAAAMQQQLQLQQQHLHLQQQQQQQPQAQQTVGGHHGLLGLQVVGLGRQESCDFLECVEALMSPGWEHRLMGGAH
jgi:hypothetical protein